MSASFGPPQGHASQTPERAAPANRTHPLPQEGGRWEGTPLNAPRIAFGQVLHRRLQPVRHAFRYPVFFLLLPLSQLETGASGVFSINRRNLLSFWYADHGARDGSHPLPWIRALLAREGVVATGEVWLQCFPRMLGYVFNPVSFWYCHSAQGELVAVLAEVNNTFGERHNYLLAHPDGRPITAQDRLNARKIFHVSPFMPVRGSYHFAFRHAPEAGEHLARVDFIELAENQLHTAISGRSQPLTQSALWRAFLAYPWMTLGVMIRIHWQALRLLARRVPFFRKPEPPLEETTR